MYKVKVKNSEFTIPKENLKAFALIKAMENGLLHGDICDINTSIKYLESIGIKVEEEN